MKYHCSFCGYVGDHGPFHNMPHIRMRCLSEAERKSDDEKETRLEDWPQEKHDLLRHMPQDHPESN